MARSGFGWAVSIIVVTGLCLAAFLSETRALPSFERPTGTSCTTCHTVWPGLTPFGRTFKLTGYAMSKSKEKYQSPPPVAGLAQFSFTHANKEYPPGTAPKKSHFIRPEKFMTSSGPFVRGRMTA